MKDFLLLDWESLKKKLIEQLSTESAKDFLYTLNPKIEPSQVYLLQEKTKFLWNRIEGGKDLVLPLLSSLSKLLSQAKKRGSFLIPELCSLVLWLRTFSELSKELQQSPFQEYFVNPERYIFLLGKITDILDVERREVKSEANYDLYLIRKEKNRLMENLFERLNRIKEKFYKMGYLQDNIFLQREGRYVLPVKPEFKYKVKGIYHGYSQSGATIFIEPFGITELANELEELTWREESVIQRILKNLSEEIFSFEKGLLEIEKAIVDVDIVLAKAKLGRIYRGIFPKVVEKGEFFIKEGFHPLLYFKSLSENRELPIPNDYYFKEAFLITGPNFGGKTVTLKTIGLLTFMALNGFLISAKEAQIPLFNKILVDLGDDQNLLEGESSFSAHLKNLKRILEEADERSLVLLDEPGRGTNFEEGSAIVWASVETLLEKGAKVVLTTHSPVIKTFALKHKKFVYAMVNHYKLHYGYLGESQAFDLALKLGLDRSLIEKAKSFLGDKSYYAYYEKYLEEIQKLEALSRELEYQKQVLEQEKIDLARLKRELQRKYEKKWEELIRSWQSEFKALVETLKSSSKGKAYQAFENFLKEREYPFSEEREEIKEGDKVYITFLQREGIVQRIKDKSAEVILGQMKLEVPLYQIVKGKDIPTTRSFKFKNFSNEISEGIVSTKKEKLILLGEDVESALNLLEQKLNECFLNKRKFLLVVHGHGSGKLRSAIRGYLKDHPLVEKFEEPPLHQGGSGATLVYLFEKN